MVRSSSGTSHLLEPAHRRNGWTASSVTLLATFMAVDTRPRILDLVPLGDGPPKFSRGSGLETLAALWPPTVRGVLSRVASSGSARSRRNRRRIGVIGSIDRSLTEGGTVRVRPSLDDHICAMDSAPTVPAMWMEEGH